MQTFHSIPQLQASIREAKQQKKRIGFVPTMGNLHAGHLSLVELARQHCDFVVVSIFVNPLQFGENEDLDAYPRTLEADQEKLISQGIDALFFPNVKDIYPHGLQQQTTVSVPELTQAHCGAARPGHFDGVTTIVNKLFNIVQADLAIFGQKDFQQLAVIRKMAQDLCLPIEIMAAKTARASDGLALSSRNQYLNTQDRKTAALLSQELEAAKQAVLTDLKAATSPNLKNIHAIETQAKQQLSDAGFTLDYFNIVDATTLAEIDENTHEIVILAAVLLGSTRLIDNLCFFH